MTMSWIAYEKDGIIAHWHSTNVMCIGKGTYANVSLATPQMEKILEMVLEDDNFRYEWVGELCSMMPLGKNEIVAYKEGNEIIIEDTFLPYNDTMFDFREETTSFKATPELLREILDACLTCDERGCPRI